MSAAPPRVYPETVRRCCPALLLALSCAPVGPRAQAVPTDTRPPDVTPPETTATREPDAASPVVAVQRPQEPTSCPQPHVGARLRVSPDLRTTRVTAWHGVYGLRPPGDRVDLPGVTKGLLWTGAYAEGAEDCHSPAPGTRTAYSFSRERDPSYALYFPSKGEGHNFLRDWQLTLADGSILRQDAAMFGPQDSARCLRACAHLAIVEVNGGRGGRGIHFVATAVTVIDSLAPLAIPEVIADLRARFIATQAAEQDELRRLYDEARDQLRKVPVGPRVDGPIRIEPTWINDPAALEVFVWRDARAAGERHTGRETVPQADCPPGSPCAYRDSGTFDIFEAAEIRSEVAARYRVDRDGVLVEETLYSPRMQELSSTSRRRR